MATKTDFSVQLQSQPGVASADPSSAARAIELSAKATTGALQALGTTAFDIFKGYQEEGFKQKQQEVITGLQASMNEVKQGDISNKAFLEGEFARIGRTQEEFRAASILSGADPEAAKESSTIFAQQQETPVLKRYREEQQRLEALREQMPKNEKEAMLRSEVLLKSYMTRFPGLANSFRSISQEVTGQKNLELYSVQNLYKEIDFIEKQKESAAKATVKAQEDSRKAFINDYTKDGLGSETQAIALYDTLSPAQRLNIANTQVNIARAAKAGESALKAGGAGLQNFVTASISAFRERSVQASAGVFVQLKNLGVTQEQLVSGTVPPEKRYDPAIKNLMEQATTKQLDLLDKEYTAAQSALRAKITEAPVDAGMARQSLSDLTSWYNASREELMKYGVGKELSLFGSEGDPKEVQTRLAIVNSMQQSLGIHPDVARQLAGAATSAQARAQYPTWGVAFDFLEKARRAALNGVPTPEWQTLLKEYDKVQTGQRITTNTPSSVAASVIHYSDTGRKLQDAAQNVGTDKVSDVLPLFINSALANTNNQSDALTKYPATITEGVRKLPASEKEVVLAQVKKISDDYLYGAVGHGDKAKVAFDKFQKLVKERETIAYSKGVETSFVDVSGTQPLMLSVKVTPDPAIKNDPMKMGEFDRNVNKFSRPSDVNAVLKAVDNTIRLRALVTGESIATLRKEFISTFLKQGLPSENSTTLAAPAAGAEQPTGGSLGERISVDVQGLSLVNQNINSLKEIRDAISGPAKSQLTAIINDFEKAK